MKYILMLALLFTFSLGDGDYDDHDDYEKRHYYSKDLSYLSLDKQQKKRVKKLLKKYQKGIKRYSELREDIIREKRALFLSDDLNKERLKKLNKRLYEFASEIEANFVENMHKILDQKQRMRFSKYIYEWKVE